jgi:CIC family chloride channel protein
VSIRGAHDVGWVSDLTVARLMSTDATTVAFDQPLQRLRAAVPIGALTRVFAIDGDGRYKGMIDVATIHDPDLDDAADGLVADDLAGARGLFLLPDQDVRRALSRFVESEEEILPVVTSTEDRRMIGYLTEALALRRYTEELEKRRSAELGVRDLFSVGPTVKG